MAATTKFSVLQRMLVDAVRAYRLLLSPWLGSSCRFEPSCSAYALDALNAYGAAAGSYLTLRRLVRCHPFCRGGHDPVPQTAPFSRPRLFADAVHTAARPDRCADGRSAD